MMDRYQVTYTHGVFGATMDFHSRDDAWQYYCQRVYGGQRLSTVKMVDRGDPNHPFTLASYEHTPDEPYPREQEA